MSKFRKQRNTLIRLVILCAVIAVGISACLLIPQPPPVDIYPGQQLQVDGQTRTYRLVVPQNLTTPAPLVFAFHGAGDSPESMAGYSQLDKLAGENGSLLVYPATRITTWNTGDSPDPDRAENAHIRFFDALLAHLARDYHIDTSRIYAIGMSNGGSFVQLLADARPGEIAAVVSQSGPQPCEMTATHPPPILLIVGGDDPVAPRMRDDAEQFGDQGRTVQFHRIAGLGHAWSTAENEQIWSFLSQFETKSPSTDELTPLDPLLPDTPSR